MSELTSVAGSRVYSLQAIIVVWIAYVAPVFFEGSVDSVMYTSRLPPEQMGNYDWIFTNWNHMFYSFQTDGNNKSEVQTHNGSSFSQLENRTRTMIELTLSRLFKWFIQVTRHRRDYLTAEMFKHCKPLFDKDIDLTYNSERHVCHHINIAHWILLLYV